VREVSEVTQTEIHTAEPLEPELSACEVQKAIEKLKGHKLPGTDQIPAEIIKTGKRTIHLEIHKQISICNKEELHEEWKELIIILIYKKGDRADCSNNRCISILQTTYKILSNILLRSSPYAEEIIGDHQCGFRSNRSTTDYIFCIRQNT
jgi:hypothetical protein